MSDLFHKENCLARGPQLLENGKRNLQLGLLAPDVKATTHHINIRSYTLQDFIITISAFEVTLHCLLASTDF